jgi:hypothetical protein
LLAKQWFSLKVNEDTGAFETFYSASPGFEQFIFSIKWVNNLQDELMELYTDELKLVPGENK